MGYGTRISPKSSAHPRSRGEHLAPVAARLATPGSSPLARGTSPSRTSSMLTPRLIPARAGNIFGFATDDEWAPAHPRSRGEHSSARHSASCRTGSSPLARGTCKPSSSFHRLPRLIPARAGNILLFSFDCASDAAHPRSRGEHNVDPIADKVILGSSPLARGTCIVTRRVRRVGRLIPARAGNIYRPPAARTFSAAHPRSRGEHFMKGVSLRRMTGSSPLARGT